MSNLKFWEHLHLGFQDTIFKFSYEPDSELANLQFDTVNVHFYHFGAIFHGYDRLAVAHLLSNCALSLNHLRFPIFINWDLKVLDVVGVEELAKF